LHTTVAPRLAIAGAWPDWILVTVVFFAMHGRGLDVLIAAWILGLLADIQSAERLGLLSLAYTLGGMLAYGVREHVFRSHPLAHFAVTLAAGLVVQAVLGTYYLVAPDQGGGHGFTGLLVALYSALFAPLAHGVLLKIGPSLGLSAPRYTHAGLARMR
jgi:rod shape-determining protein MreD